MLKKPQWIAKHKKNLSIKLMSILQKLTLFEVFNSSKYTSTIYIYSTIHFIQESHVRPIIILGKKIMICDECLLV